MLKPLLTRLQAVARVMSRTPRRAVSRLDRAGRAAGEPVPSGCGADAGWFESGDTRLRTDLLLLNDAEVIRLPVNQWPLPRAAVQYALANAKTALGDECRSRGCARARARACERLLASERRLAFDTAHQRRRARPVA